MQLYLSTLLSLALSIVAPLHASAAREHSLWTALAAGDHVLLMRHTIAPGVGDPDNFRLGDCSTQRNLDEAGRRQAADIGALMRKNGIASARVYTSQWCRASDTAKLLGVGPVKELTLLNSFFSRGGGAEQTKELRLWIARQDLRTPLVLVTHQVNITALSGVDPASGEIVAMRRGAGGALSLVGRLKTD
jgi:phosphohistidine phosphatase SixA